MRGEVSMTETHLKGDLISRDKLKLTVMRCQTIDDVLLAIDNQPTEIPDDYYAGFLAGLEKQYEERSKQRNE